MEIEHIRKREPITSYLKSFMYVAYFLFLFLNLGISILFFRKMTISAVEEDFCAV